MADKLTEKQLLFLAYLPECRGNIRLAMDKAGYAETTAISEVVKPLKDEIISLAKDILAYDAIKAATAFGDIIDNPNTMGAGNKISAAKELLDRIGVIKEDTKEKVNPVKVTFYLPEKNPVIDYLEDSHQKPLDITPTMGYLEQKEEV